MIFVRWTIAALLLSGTFTPLGADVLVDASSEVYLHSHDGEAPHSHRHDAGHHEDDHELGSNSDREARLRPPPTTIPGREAEISFLPPAAAAGAARLSFPSSGFRLPGASPPPRESARLGRAPPA